MDEDTQNYSNSDNSGPRGTANQQLQDTPPPPPKSFPAQKPRKKRKTVLVSLLILMLISAIGGAYAFYAISKKTKPAENNAQQEQSNFTPPQSLYYQVGSKIIKYSQDDKSISSLTAALPAGAEVLDFMEDDASWRAIYTTQGSGAEKPKIFLIESDKPAKALVEDAEYITVAASAQYRMAAYTIPADTTQPSGTASRSRTFLARNNEKIEELFTSNPWNQKTAATEVKNHLYAAKELSNNGDKLLFSLYTCFQCDGPPLAAAFELDLKSKEAKLVYQSQESGYVTFNSFTGGYQGYKVIETNGLGLASDDPYKLKISQVDTPGGAAKQEFEATETEWANLIFSPDRQYVAIEKKEKTYDETGKTEFGGLYTFGSGAGAKLTAQTVRNLPDKFSVLALGNWRGDCFGVALYERAANNSDATKVRQQVGAICRGDNGYDYSHVDDLEYNADEPYQYTKVLERL